MDKRGYGQRERHPLYKKWCWHKRSGMCKAWREDFWKFVEQVGDRPSEKHQLRRTDRSEPIGPSNFHWQEAIPITSQTDRAEKAAYMRKWRKRYPQKSRNNDLKKMYGITLDQYNAMLERQGGGCAICGTTENQTGRYKNLSVDHCHDSGEIRGLLCNNCNRGLGLLQDSPDTLRAALRYLLA